MNTILTEKPENTTITVKTLFNRGGYRYTHAFIGEYAISGRLEMILKNEFNFRCYDGSMIPDSFFEKYNLIEVGPDYGDRQKREFVTSDYWYTCNPNFCNVNLL